MKQFVDLVNRLESVPLGGPVVTRPAPARAFRFSPEQITAITSDYEAGATMVSLAEQHGVKRQSIAALLKREGIAIRRRKAITPDQVDEAVRLYAAGSSSATIGAQLGFDAATIWRALRKRGVPMRSPNDPGRA